MSKGLFGSTLGSAADSSEVPRELTQYFGRGASRALLVGGAGPEVDTVGIACRSGCCTERASQVVNGWIAKRSCRVVATDEVVGEGAGGAAGEGVRDDSPVRTRSSQSLFVSLRGAALRSTQQKRADDHGRCAGFEERR